MKFRALALALLSFPALLSAQEAPAPKPEVIALKAARLFDGRGDAAVPNGVVIVEGGKIRAAGSGLAIPAGARVIDLGDATLLARLHRRPHPPDRRVDRRLAQAFVDDSAASVAEPAIRATVQRPARSWRRASPPSATSAAATTSTSACATRSRAGWSPGRGCWWRSTPWAPAAATATTAGFRYDRFGPEPGIERGHRHAARTGSARPCASRSSTAPT